MGEYLSGWASGWNGNLWHYFLPTAEQSACGRLRKYNGIRDRNLRERPEGAVTCQRCLEHAKASSQRISESLAAADGFERSLTIDGRNMDEFRQNAIGGRFDELQELVGDAVAIALNRWLKQWGDAEACYGCEVIKESDKFKNTVEGRLCGECAAEIA